MTDKDRVIGIEKPLLHWYHAHARILPWREEPAPYRVWISEIMLQQTRVEAVKPFFERFMKALPEISSLAEIEEDRLLKLWEGLGYYNRARNLKKSAQILMEKYNGELPGDYELLLTLPGIGCYTAGAIASIAFGIPMPAVDGNVLRVITRILANDWDIKKQSVKSEVETILRNTMPKDRAGSFNQALMELGATVCVPNGIAKCNDCPLKSICLAKEQNIVVELPKKTPKKPRKLEKKTVLVIKDGDRAAIQKRKRKGLLAGLYEFPNLEGHLSSDEVLKQIRDWKMSPIRIQRLEDSNHIFSHIEWRMIGYAVQIEELEEGGGSMLFVEQAQSEEIYPIPAAFAAYTRYMNIRLGQDKYADR